VGFLCVEILMRIPKRVKRPDEVEVPITEQIKPIQRCYGCKKEIPSGFILCDTCYEMAK
jgi:rRNA maturation endonuclease Nob1